MLRQFNETLEIVSRGRGLAEITQPIAAWLSERRIDAGLLMLFVRHTSASLLFQENAHADVQGGLDRFFPHLVPDGDPLFRHHDEGPDDMPAHILAALTATQLAIPVNEGRLVLGTWQGIYL